VVKNGLLASGHAVDGRRGADIVPEKLIALECDPRGEHQQRYSADGNRHVHQQQAASGHSCDENPDCDND
jgi:hypothetical protein